MMTLTLVGSFSGKGGSASMGMNWHGAHVVPSWMRVVDNEKVYLGCTVSSTTSSTSSTSSLSSFPCLVPLLAVSNVIVDPSFEPRYVLSLPESLLKSGAVANGAFLLARIQKGPYLRPILPISLRQNVNLSLTLKHCARAS